MSTITQVISNIAPAADPYTMDIPTFSSTAAQNVTDIVDMTAELNTWAGQVNTVKGEMVTHEANASASASTATTQAGIATTQANNAAASALTAINAPGTNATSTTSDTVALGSTTITIQTGKAFVVGMFVTQASTASPQNYNYGQITAYDNGTGSLTINVLSVGGSGTFAAWTISLSGVLSGGDFKADGTVPMTGPINEFHGADISSAGTINLTTATGNIIDVTGTTTITAITLADGYSRTVRFTGVLTLTNGASLVLPGGANITTAAGDFAVFRGYAAGVVRCEVYTKASGKSIVDDGSWVLLGKTTASASATVDLEATFDSTYSAYAIVINGARFSVDEAEVSMRLKVGGSYVTADYAGHSQESTTGSAAYTAIAYSATNRIKVCSAIDSTHAGSNFNAVFNLSNPSSTALFKGISWHGRGLRETNSTLLSGMGIYTAGTGALTGVRFYSDSGGNIDSGTFSLYGIKG